MRGTAGDNSPVRVLVIEDNADDRELLLRQLKKSGMDSHVRFIDDGLTALNFLVQPPSPGVVDSLVAIFLDLKLPSLGGLDLLRQLRDSEKYRALPVIVMTSSNNPKDMEECRKLKVTSYVPKPVSFTSFSKAVADVFHLPKLGDSAQPQEEF
jgi:two-component system, response regulator